MFFMIWIYRWKSKFMSPYHFIKLNDIVHVFIALNLTDCIIRTKFMIHDS